MNRILMTIIMMLVTSISASQDNKDNDPEFRRQVIETGMTFFSQGKISDAFQQFAYGVINWNDNEQKEHQKLACRSLFMLLYTMDTVSEYEQILSECPSELKDIWFEKNNRNYEPIVKAQHCYPKEALEDGTEGWVDVQFDIKRNGRTRYVKVIDSSDSVFHKCAIQAAKKYLYLPEIKDGKKIITKGVKSRLNWKLNN